MGNTWRSRRRRGFFGKRCLKFRDWLCYYCRWRMGSPGLISRRGTSLQNRNGFGCGGTSQRVRNCECGFISAMSHNAQYGKSREPFPSGRLFLCGLAGFGPNPDLAASRTCFRCLTEGHGRPYRFCCFPNHRVLGELKLPSQANIAEQFSPAPAQKLFDPAG
jgi:hypothetical protein